MKVNICQCPRLQKRKKSHRQCVSYHASIYYVCLFFGLSYSLLSYFAVMMSNPIQETGNRSITLQHRSIYRAYGCLPTSGSSTKPQVYFKYKQAKDRKTPMSEISSSHPPCEHAKKQQPHLHHPPLTTRLIWLSCVRSNLRESHPVSQLKHSTDPSSPLTMQTAQKRPSR